jgi:hypothetical protein
MMTCRNWMTILVGTALLLAMAWTSTGCTDTDKIIKTSNALYLDIKTIVTDPEVAAGIPPSTMARLADLERNYLEAVQVLRDRPESTEPLDVLVYCADEILIIINGAPLPAGYQSAVAAIRISIGILRNHLGA